LLYSSFSVFWGGGQGYGVNLEDNAEYCLIENNIFYDLRHAMIAQDGSQYNVFGYNYSRKPHQTNVPVMDSKFIGDMVLHGRDDEPGSVGPTKNLFEGNVGKFIWIDSFWGENGKNNTFLRNRASKYGLWIFGWKTIFMGNITGMFHLIDLLIMGAIYHGLEGIPNQPKQNFINNYFESSHWYWCQKRFPRRMDSWHESTEKNSRVKKLNFWGQYYTRWWSDYKKNRKYSSLIESEISYYLVNDEQPDFIPELIYDWPFNPNTDTNPAQWRWYYGNSKTYSRRLNNDYNNITIWDQNQSIYSDYTVEKGDQLIIQDGVTVTFYNNSRLIVKGSLYAVGEESSHIIFTGYNQGFWEGIKFGGEVRPLSRQFLV